MKVPRESYLVDDKGKKVAVVLSLKEYQQLLEDIEDLKVFAERRDEPSEPWEVVKKRLEERWSRTA
ncbi:MAG: type II toxin-antitoxin system Phd/YefM family antitoxin [Chloroflexota bacterium]